MWHRTSRIAFYGSGFRGWWDAAGMDSHYVFDNAHKPSFKTGVVMAMLAMLCPTALYILSLSLKRTTFSRLSLSHNTHCGDKQPVSYSSVCSHQSHPRISSYLWLFFPNSLDFIGFLCFLDSCGSLSSWSTTFLGPLGTSQTLETRGTQGATIKLQELKEPQESKELRELTESSSCTAYKKRCYAFMRHYMRNLAHQLCSYGSLCVVTSVQNHIYMKKLCKT